MKRFFALIFLLIILASISSAFAHSGRTDSNGGHRSGSSYHYHHGYPAHQHTDGICPYDFDDQTNHDSSSGVRSSPSPSPEILPVKSNSINWGERILSIVGIGIMVLFFGWPLFVTIIASVKSLFKNNRNRN